MSKKLIVIIDLLLLLILYQLLILHSQKKITNTLFLMQVIIKIYWRIDALLEWLIVAIAENMHALLHSLLAVFAIYFLIWLSIFSLLNREKLYCSQDEKVKQSTTLVKYSHSTFDIQRISASLESWGVGSMRRSKDSVHVSHKVHTLLPNLASVWPIHGIGSALISLSVQNFVTSVKLSFYRNWYQNI